METIDSERLLYLSASDIQELDKTKPSGSRKVKSTVHVNVVLIEEMEKQEKINSVDF